MALSGMEAIRRNKLKEIPIDQDGVRGTSLSLTTTKAQPRVVCRLPLMKVRTQADLILKNGALYFYILFLNILIGVKRIPEKRPEKCPRSLSPCRSLVARKYSFEKQKFYCIIVMMAICLQTRLGSSGRSRVLAETVDGRRNGNMERRFSVPSTDKLHLISLLNLFPYFIPTGFFYVQTRRLTSPKSGLGLGATDHERLVTVLTRLRGFPEFLATCTNLDPSMTEASIRFHPKDVSFKSNTPFQPSNSALPPSASLLEMALSLPLNVASHPPSSNHLLWKRSSKLIGISHVL